MAEDSIYYGDGDGGIYTVEGMERLWNDHRIVYIGGVHAFKVIPRDHPNPLIELWFEDDCLLFNNICNDTIRFDAAWLHKLKELIEVTLIRLEERGQDG